MITSTILNTPRFGAIEYTQDDVVTFRDGMIGMPNCRHFLILQHKEGSPFRWLQCLDEPAIAFLVVEPQHYAPEYRPAVHESALAAIELLEETPNLVYTVVTIPKGKPEEMTLNLAGPIVINAVNRLAKQVVLEDPRWPLKYPVVPPGAGAAKAA